MRTFLILVRSAAITKVCIFILLIIHPFSIFSQEVHPGNLEFRLQAVRRMIFDKSQNILLAGLWLIEIVTLRVMHKPFGEQANNPQLIRA